MVKDLLEIVTDEESATAMKTEKVSFHVEAEDDICEANDALAVEKYEKKNVTNDILNILMNASKCVDLEKPAEAGEHIHCAKMKKVLDYVQVVDYTYAEAKNAFEDLERTIQNKSRFARARFQKKKRRLKLWSREKTRVKMKLKKKTKFEGFKVWSKRKKKKKLQ